jgi:DNA mismatch repair protein MutL
MGRIRRLPPELVNQIAAGEVVERPASVVKELAENSVDAGASRVTVRLSRGGCGLITVIDDGCGMSRDDALTSLERHATSKLLDKEGLFHILTKGFRGEAIPAIASVSRFTLVTSEAEQLSGTRLVIEGGAPPVVEDAPAVGGTRIDVEDLFFNVPARRKFLKREQTELLHCEDAVTRLALAHPEVGFTLEHEGRVLWSSPPSATEPKQRAAAVLGTEAAPHLLAIDERRLGLTVTGFIAAPEFTLANARGLMTFVNHRYVRDRGLTSAIQRAYQDSLPPGRQPVALVFIELDPAASAEARGALLGPPLGAGGGRRRHHSGPHRGAVAAGIGGARLAAGAGRVRAGGGAVPRARPGPSGLPRAPDAASGRSVAEPRPIWHGAADARLGAPRAVLLPAALHRRPGPSFLGDRISSGLVGADRSARGE